MELKCELEGGGTCPDYLVLKSGILTPRTSSDIGSLLSKFLWLSLVISTMSIWTFQAEARKDESKVSVVNRMSCLVIKSQ